MSDQVIVLTIQWSRGAETFGPWTPCEDGSHMDEITAFMKSWHVREGKPEASYVVALVTSPEAYEQRAAST